MKYIYHEQEARLIYSLMTDRQPMIHWATNHLLARLCFDYTHKKRRKDRRIFQLFPVFRHYMNRNISKNFDLTEAFKITSR